MKPRIAFCFSGQARTFDVTYPYFKRNLFDAAIEQGFEYDIFCAVEDDQDVEKIYQMHPTVVEKIKSKNVTGIIYENHGEFMEEFLGKRCFFVENIQSTMFPNYLQQIYKIYRSNQIKEIYGLDNNIKYNVIVRLRFDLLFLDAIDFTEIMDCITKDDMGVVLSLPKDVTNIYDVFAFGSDKSMNIYSSMFFELDNLFTLLHQGKIYIVPYKILVYLLQGLVRVMGNRAIIKNTFSSLLAIVTSFFRNRGIDILDAEHALLKHLKDKNINIFPKHFPFILLKENPGNNYLHI